ncbi:hypothetical protein ACFL0D_09485 [Thermoproteota archaeon]
MLKLGNSWINILKHLKESLNLIITQDILELKKHFEEMVEVPLIRHGKRQRIETLINEEALFLARYIRNERKEWVPRFAYSRIHT